MEILQYFQQLHQQVEELQVLITEYLEVLEVVQEDLDQLDLELQIKDLPVDYQEDKLVVVLELPEVEVEQIQLVVMDL